MGRRWPATGVRPAPPVVRGTRWCPDPAGCQRPPAGCRRRIRPGRAGTGRSRPGSGRSCSRGSCYRWPEPAARYARSRGYGARRSLRGGRSCPWGRGCGGWRGRVHVAAVRVAHPGLRRWGLGRGAAVAAPARGLRLGLTALGLTALGLTALGLTALGLAGRGAAPPAGAGARGARVGPCGARVGPCGARVGPCGARVGPCGARVGPCGARVGPCGLPGRVAVPAAGGRVVPAPAARPRVGLVSGDRAGVAVPGPAGIAVVGAGRAGVAFPPSAGVPAGGAGVAGGIGVSRAGIAVRRSRVRGAPARPGVATSELIGSTSPGQAGGAAAWPRSGGAPGGPVGPAVVCCRAAGEGGTGQRVVVGAGAGAVRLAPGRRLRHGRDRGGGHERSGAGRRVGRLVVVPDWQPLGGLGRPGRRPAGQARIGIRAVRPPGGSGTAARPPGAVGGLAVAAGGRAGIRGGRRPCGRAPGGWRLGPGSRRLRSGGRLGRSGCGAGLGAAGRGRERLVSGQLCPVLLVGELVPLRARPVIVIVVVPAAGRPAAALALILRPGGPGFRLRDVRPDPREDVRIRQIRVGADARGGGGPGVVQCGPRTSARARGWPAGRGAAPGADGLRGVLVAPVPAGGLQALGRLPLAAPGGALTVAAGRGLVAAGLVEGRLVPPVRAAVAAWLPGRAPGQPCTAPGWFTGHARVGAPAGIAGPAVQPVPDGLPSAWLVIITTTPRHEEKNRDEDRDDNGDHADHEQKHCTTQQAMAVWAAPARPTRPSRGPSPVSLAPRFHPRLSY